MPIITGRENVLAVYEKAAQKGWVIPCLCSENLTTTEAILTAAELEGASCCIYTFTMQSDGSLFSGMDAGPVLKSLEDAGAAAVGFNCVAADAFTPGLVSKLRRYVRCPIICKPNAGIPVIGEDKLPHYPMEPKAFGAIMKDCRAMGAALLGGCCGTDPRFIAELGII